MYGEYPLYRAAVCNSADSECLAYAAVLLCDYSSLKDLDSVLVAFLNSNMHPYGVTDVELRHVFLQA